jgi:YidC/Oxa1 family membrane protein insertase
VHVPLHAKLVILVAVLISMSTTFLTIRQSQKRGMMPAATPDNPMASSQKYMTYIMPFFALTGLYWPFGLVLYWCTTNIWTLGQQFLLGLRYPYTPPAPVEGTGSTVASKPAGKPAAASARSLTGGASSARASSARPPAAKGQQNGSKTAANGNGSATAGASSVLKRFSKRTEPEPQPDLPEVKLVRHQTQRQPRSKRSGKR